MPIPIRVCDDFEVARAFHRVKTEMTLPMNITRWKTRAALLAAAAGRTR
jgi:hypothetical protein